MSEVVDDKKATTELNIAFLICDEPNEKTLRKHGGFDDMLHNLLEPILQQEHKHVKLVVKGYEVVKAREYPSSEQLKSVDCVCISGSFVDDAGVDKPWIARLSGFIVYLHDEWPAIRQIGICFGHQVISRAFGATVKSNPAGWEIGSVELRLTDRGKQILASPEKPEDLLRIQQVHSDIVDSVPEDFELLASSERCKVQSLAKFYKYHDTKKGKPPGFSHGLESISPYRDVHILTCQGHAEWGPDVIDPLVDEFLKEGKIDQELAESAKRYTKEEDDAFVFGRALLRVCGVIGSKTRYSHDA